MGKRVTNTAFDGTQPLDFSFISISLIDCCIVLIFMLTGKHASMKWAKISFSNRGGEAWLSANQTAGFFDQQYFLN